MPEATLVQLGVFRSAFTVSPTVWVDSPELTPHADKLWVRDYLRDRRNIRLALPSGPSSGAPFEVELERFRQHGVILGKPGYGKSNTAQRLLMEHLMAGTSALVMDVQEQTIQKALYCARQAGLSRDQITVIYPASGLSGVPGWNLFAGDVDQVQEIAARFVELIDAVNSHPLGSRMAPLLEHAVTIIAAHGLSLVELVAFLRNEPYRTALLERVRGTDLWNEFEYSHEYFAEDFTRLSGTDRETSVRGVMDRLAVILNKPYLKAMLASDTNTVDLASLWKRQHLLLVHIDEKKLGARGATILSGMMAQQLRLTALAKPGPVPVLFLMDELGLQAKFVGEPIADIMAGARQQGVRVLAATQNLDQLPPKLANALLGLTSFQLFFQLSAEDARSVGATLSTGRTKQVEKLALRSKGDALDLAESCYTLTDPAGKRIRLNAAEWQGAVAALTVCQAQDHRAYRLSDALYNLVRLRGVRRLYVEAPEATEPVELSDFWAELPARSIQLTGPDPLGVRILFPRPEVDLIAQRSGEELRDEMRARLLSLEIGCAIARLPDGAVAETQVFEMPFPDPLPAIQPYLKRGQHAEEIAATIRRRKARMLEMMSARPPVKTARARPTNAPARKGAPKASAPPELPEEIGFADDGTL